MPGCLPGSAVAKTSRNPVRSSPDITVSLKWAWLPTLPQRGARLAASSPARRRVAATAASKSCEQRPVQTRPRASLLICENARPRPPSSCEWRGRVREWGAELAPRASGVRLLLHLALSQRHAQTAACHAPLTRTPGGPCGIRWGYFWSSLGTLMTSVLLPCHARSWGRGAREPERCPRPAVHWGPNRRGGHVFAEMKGAHYTPGPGKRPGKTRV